MARNKVVIISKPGHRALTARRCLYWMKRDKHRKYVGMLITPDSGPPLLISLDGDLVKFPDVQEIFEQSTTSFLVHGDEDAVDLTD